MKNTELSLHLTENLFRLTEYSVDINNKESPFKISKLIETNNQIPFFLNFSEKILIDQAQLIETTVKKINSKLNNVRLIIPDEYTFSEIVDFPYLPEKELISAVKYQADQIIPIPIDKVAIDIAILNEDKKQNKKKILIIASTYELIDYLTRLIEASGLIPEVLENEISALMRLINNNRFFLEKEPCVFFNFGFTSSFFYFYHPELRLIVDLYKIKVGLNLFLKELNLNFNFNDQKAYETLINIGLSKNASIDFEKNFLPIFNELVKNFDVFIQTIKGKYKLSSINKVYLLNQNAKIKNFETYLSQLRPYHFIPFPIKTQPLINHPEEVIFNLAHYEL